MTVQMGGNLLRELGQPAVFSSFHLALYHHVRGLG